MHLVIVESPAKAKTIEKYLGPGYKVVSSVGHIRDLPKSNKKAIDFENGFQPNYQTTPGKEEVVQQLKELCAKADNVVLATDPDREGEAIAWHVAQVCDLDDPKRIVFHEITKDAVQKAIEHPRGIDEDLRTAQEARRVLDRLFGYDLSALIWKKVRYGLSAGRVQSPALRVLMEREREIRAFVPEDYWVITAETETKKKEALPLTSTEEPKSEAEASRIVSAGKNGTWNVASVSETEATRSSRPPFITSTLQQAASSRLGFAPSRTMRLAQSLYEAGHITYMRTDSTNLSTDAQKQIVSYIAKAYGDKYAEAKQYKTKSKSAQEAHEAIRPTDIGKEAAGANADQKKLYKLIWQRAVASQMANAKTTRTKIIAHITPPSGVGAVPEFQANGSRVTFDGWLKADPEARGEDVELPKVEEGEPLTLVSISSEAKQTEPPKRYTEAGLVKELEKRGIGRPSTYASIIKTIVDRGYVDRSGRTLIPTDLGDVVETFLEKNFPTYISDSFTAEMEDELDEIARGERGYTETLQAFYEPFTKEIEAKKDTGKITNLGDAPDDIRCPKCGGKMVIKLGRGGKFYSCAKFPDCDGARTMDGEEMKSSEPKKTGEKCPRCEKGELVEREGKYGAFIGCNRYPKCRYIKPSENGDEKPQNSTGVTCPECGKGEIVERKGRFGAFYSCSRYPECTFAMKAKPTGAKCPECGSLMMEGTKTIPERCSNKACPNHNPHKK